MPINRMNSPMLFVAVAIFVSLFAPLLGSTQSTWTKEERKNANHFFLSLEADAAAARIINKQRSPGIVSQKDIDRIQQYRKTALHEARLVADIVLDKAHHQLREHWRNEYEKGLQLYIKTIESPDSYETYDHLLFDQMHGQLLLDRFTDWFNDHNQKIKIPMNR